MAENFEMSEADLQPERSLETLGLDSLSVIEFMFVLEDEFKIKLSDERIEIKTINDIVTLVDKLVAEQHSSEPKH